MSARCNATEKCHFHRKATVHKTPLPLNGWHCLVDVSLGHEEACIGCLRPKQTASLGGTGHQKTRPADGGGGGCRLQGMRDSHRLSGWKLFFNPSMLELDPESLEQTLQTCDSFHVHRSVRAACVQKNRSCAWRSVDTTRS